MGHLYHGYVSHNQRVIFQATTIANREAPTEMALQKAEDWVDQSPNPAGIFHGPFLGIFHIWVEMVRWFKFKQTYANKCDFTN